LAISEKLPERQSVHDRLLEYVGLLVIGLIVLIAGLSSLPGGWETTLLGAGLTGVGAFEVRITYNKINYEDKRIRAKQEGQGNIQNNQTSPVNSPSVGKARDIIYNLPPQPETKTIREASNVYVGTLQPDKAGRRSTMADPAQARAEGEIEELCSGEIHFEDFQEFEAEVSKGDRIALQVRAEHPISVQIMNEDDYDDFDSNDDDNEVYWKSPKVTNYGYSWLAKKREKVFVLVVNETDQDDWDTGEAVATVTINVVRMNRG
jgi:hypothetical protein